MHFPKALLLLSLATYIDVTIQHSSKLQKTVPIMLLRNTPLVGGCYTIPGGCYSVDKWFQGSW